MFPKLKFTEAQILEYYSRVTPDMVRASLSASRGSFFDLLNLLSPEAAQPEYRAALRETATKARRRYYGKTVSIFAPLYISNTCAQLPAYPDKNENVGSNFARRFGYRSFQLGGKCRRRHNFKQLGSR